MTGHSVAKMGFRNFLFKSAVALSFAVLLILSQGYRFGTHTTVSFVPVIESILGQNQLANDFNILTHRYYHPNFNALCVLFVRPFGLPVTFFAGYFLCAVFLGGAVYRLAVLLGGFQASSAFGDGFFAGVGQPRSRDQLAVARKNIHIELHRMAGGSYGLVLLFAKTTVARGLVAWTGRRFSFSIGAGGFCGHRRGVVGLRQTRLELALIGRRSLVWLIFYGFVLPTSAGHGAVALGPGFYRAGRIPDAASFCF
ncbi:MAG: hypothetical protein WCG06_02155 [Candidatus Omnitrophota bacterium]